MDDKTRNLEASNIGSMTLKIRQTADYCILSKQLFLTTNRTDVESNQLFEPSPGRETKRVGGRKQAC